jgi:hypothetical protein
VAPESGICQTNFVADIFLRPPNSGEIVNDIGGDSKVLNERPSALVVFAGPEEERG